MANAIADEVTRNEVVLVGRLAAQAEERVMPSGDRMLALRVVVDRPEGGPSRQRVDAIECAVWGARVRRTVSAWKAGDVVEVQGAIRRRFFRTPGGAASRVEVEVASARRLVRAPAA